MSEKIYDVAVIGSGPAGISAAIYAVRKGRSTLMIGEQVGGQIMTTAGIENYIGFASTTGPELSMKFMEHLESVGVEKKSYTKVTKLTKDDRRYVMELDNGETVKSRTVIITAGSSPRELGVKGEKELLSRGVAYCATCDGPFYAGLDVVVCGGGNTAIESAIDLSKIAKSVTIVHRSEFRADTVLLNELKKLDNVKVHIQTQVLEVFGEHKVEGIKVFDKREEKEFDIKTDGVFVEIGYLPNTKWLEGIVELSKTGEIIIDSACKTSDAGIFAAGDITNTPYKQIIIAAGEGAKAALSANAYLQLFEG